MQILTQEVPVWFYLLNNACFFVFLYIVWKDLKQSVGKGE